MHRNDIISLLTLVGGVCGILGALVLTTVTSVQMSLHPGAPVVVPPWAIITSAVIGAVGTLASQVIRIINVPADTPQQAAAVATAAVQQTKGP